MLSLVSEEIELYAERNTRLEPEQLQKLMAFTYEHMELPQMLTGRLEGRLLKLLVQLVQPKLLVEVGTFTGYSALSMAEGLPGDGRIITCDNDPDVQKVAQTAFDASPYKSKIELRMGDAIDTIRNLDEVIDFSFIDADKVMYPEYYEAILEKTRPGGVILLDNMLQSGRVLKPKDAASRTIHQLNEMICKDRRVENVLLTVRDGVQFVRKRS
ncbi:class I SAM-dependent methyltransferase [Nitrospira defluvii]|nr:class I SAM-dependent methyltransferase [Nitrospira defluvii]